MTRIDMHPSVLLKDFRNFRNILWAATIAEFFWAVGLFLFSLNPPDALMTRAPHPTFLGGVMYSTYSALHASYIFISLFFSHFLASRGWFRAAAFGCMIPGFGFGFGIFQLVAAWMIFKETAKPEWVKFFAWRAK